MDENTAERKTLAPKLQLILTVLAILAPLFYLTGLSYYQGLFTTYGISIDTFTLNIQDTYVAAYIAIAQLWLPLFLSIKNILLWMITFEGLVCISLFIISTAILLLLLKKTLTSKTYKKLSSWLGHKLKKYHWDTNNYSMAFGLAGILSYILVAFVYMPFGLFCLWILPSVLGYSPAKDTANKAIEEYLEKGCFYEENKRWSNCKILQSKDGKILYEGILIASTETRIAFFTKSGAIVAQIPDGALIINTPKGL